MALLTAALRCAEHRMHRMALITSGCVPFRFMSMLSWCELFDAKLTQREARMIFALVNIDDELFKRDPAGGQDSSTELVFDEFVECMVRVAWEKCEAGLASSVPGVASSTPAEMLTEFLVDDIDPEARRAVGEALILLHPPLPLAGFSMWMGRRCQQK